MKKAAYWHAGGHKILRDARAVLFTSEEERLQAAQSFRPYQCNGVTVGFGTTGALATRSSCAARSSRHFPELMGKKLVLYLGRVNPKKGLDILIEAFARTASADNAFRLVIAGPEQLGVESSLGAPRIRPGNCDENYLDRPSTNEQKWGAFYASDVSVSLASGELRAGRNRGLSCGLPVLISNKVNICVRSIQPVPASWTPTT